MEIGASPPSNLFVSANVIKIFLLLIRNLNILLNMLLPSDTEEVPFLEAATAGVL